MNTNNDNLVLPKAQSWQMFDEISPKYDLLNHLLSFGIDRHWRRSIAKHLSLKLKKNVLDLATGTGDVLLTLIRDRSDIESAIGIDLAEKMLSIGHRKISEKHLDEKITLSKGDANDIPFESNAFENVTMAFGIRNVNDPTIVLCEMNRVLIDGGRAIVLEFSLPNNRLLRALHFFYLRTFVPFIGGIVSGNKAAYRYLNQTIESFPYGQDFCALMLEAGFKKAEAYPLLLGVSTIYVGEK